MFLKYMPLLGILFYLPGCNAAADPSDFLTFSFDEFLHNMVNTDDRIEFRTYYKKMMKQYEKKKMQQQGQKKYERKLSELEQLGRSSVQVKQPLMAKKIDQMQKKSPSDREQHQLKKFLVRYGSYEQFLQKKGSRYGSLLAKTQTYIKNAGDSISSWFTSWRKPKTI